VLDRQRRMREELGPSCIYARPDRSQPSSVASPPPPTPRSDSNFATNGDGRVVATSTDDADWIEPALGI